MVRGARAAVVFLTRVPAGGFPYSGDEWRWASGWFPLVGAAVGVLLSAVWWVAQPIGRLPAAVVVFALSILLTGGLHEDGLADTADALGGATSRERIFEILKDSRVGSFGALALFLSLILRVALLAQLANGAVGALILSQSIARLPPVWLMAVLPYVTPESTAKSRAVARASGAQIALASLLAAMIIAILSATKLADPIDAVIAASVAGVGAAVAGYWFHRRAGGVTGDFLGATEQLGECLVLLALVSRRGAS